MVQIAVMGYGVVGSGAVEILSTHTANIEKRANQKIDIKYILDLRDFLGSPYEDKFIKDFNVIVEDPDVKVVVEAMGGLEPAYTFVKKSLSAGKSVVTSNKELVAAKGAELLKIAKENNVNFLFEASVGGGIPIIRPMSQCLAANDVIEIAGILNGTTNFILTKMIKEQMSFETALKLAQDLGYAERNPSADVDGHDACRKICILASLAFGKHVYPEQVHTEGITKLTLEDVDYASNWGGVIKLVGRTKMLENGKVHVIVSPMFVNSESQLSTVDDVFNAIMVRGDSTGDVLFYGKGAGKLPTASAVVADVIDCVKHLETRKYLMWEDGSEDYVEDYTEDVLSIYIRATAKDAGVLENAVQDIFGNVKKLYRENAPENELAFIVNPASEKIQREKIQHFEEKGIEILGIIRIGDDL